MSKLSLTLACGLYDRMLALYTGEVQPAGVDLNFIPFDNPREIFDRMVGNNEFDISEMSSSEYVSVGRRRLVIYASSELLLASDAEVES